MPAATQVAGGSSFAQTLEWARYSISLRKSPPISLVGNGASRQTLYLGYNLFYFVLQACPFIIDIYAEKCKPRLNAVSLASSNRQLQKVLCKSAILKGEGKPMEGYESVFIYTYKNDARITSIIENKVCTHLVQWLEIDGQTDIQLFFNNEKQLPYILE